MSMKLATKIILSGLIIPGFLAGLLLHDIHQSRRPDCIKIHSVKYLPPSSKVLKDFPKYKDNLFLNFKIKGYDKDGIKEVHYYLDGKLEESIKSNPPPKSLKDENQLILSPDFGKGKHTLKAILEDYKGNKVEDSYVFEMK